MAQKRMPDGLRLSDIVAARRHELFFWRAAISVAIAAILFGRPATLEGIGGLVAAILGIFVIVAGIIALASGLRLGKLTDDERKARALEIWREDRNRLAIDAGLALQKGERIISDGTPCVVWSQAQGDGNGRWQAEGKDAMITDRRIVFGRIGFGFPSRGLSFGKKSYWLPGKNLPPDKGTASFLLAEDVGIDRLSYGKDSYGEFIKMEFGIGRSNFGYFVYHPEAERAFGEISGKGG